MGVVLVVHQTDKFGTKAGFRNNPDRNWNLDLIGNNWYMGRTEFSTWRLGSMDFGMDNKQNGRKPTLFI